MNGLRARARQYAIRSFLSNYDDEGAIRLDFADGIAVDLDDDFNLPDEIIAQQFFDKGYFHYLVLTSNNKKEFDKEINDLIRDVRNLMLSKRITCKICKERCHHSRIDTCEKCDKSVCSNCYNTNEDDETICVSCK